MTGHYGVEGSKFALANVLFVALVVTVVGSLAGQWLSVKRGAEGRA